MKQIFDYEKLFAVANANRVAYACADPYPHAVIDDLAEPDVLDEVLRAFPSPTELHWYKYDNPLEKKLAINHLDLLPELIGDVLREFNSKEFVDFLQRLTGIEGLIADPQYYGGGLHQIERGGKLDVHADFNIHPQSGLYRRINVLLYLNKDWHEDFGGHLELWAKDMQRAVQRVLPFFNRMVAFSISDTAFHGHPEPLTCPEGRTRKSLALYYYTEDRPEAEKSTPHSTLYQRRPEDEWDSDLERLRAKRAKGRVADSTT